MAVGVVYQRLSVRYHLTLENSTFKCPKEHLDYMGLLRIKSLHNRVCILLPWPGLLPLQHRLGHHV